MRRPHCPFPSPLIEPLESRIAPAAITWTPVNYSDVLKNSKGQTVLEFFNADPSSSFYTNNPGHATLSGANLAIAKVLGEDPNTYFIKVSTGEDVRIETNVGFSDLVNVGKGNVLAVFTDLNAIAGNGNAGKVESTELTGLALGNKVSVHVGTGVNEYQVGGTGPYYGGWVVTNFNDLTSTLGGVGESAGNATDLLNNTVVNLTIAGPIEGGFIAGGPVDQLSATGAVTEILTGDAANGLTYSFNAVQNTNTAGTTLNVGAPNAGVAGPSISDATIGSGGNPLTLTPGLILMGSGGPGAAGGSLLGLTVLDQALTPVTIIGGAGGSGGVAKTSGGAGGSISDVVFNPPTTLVGGVPNALIELEGGAGGTGTAKGGSGGSITNVFADYNALGQSQLGAPNMIGNFEVLGGMGGAGATGGAGGSLSNINIVSSTPHDLTAGAIEYQLIAGTGGTSATGGHGGAGGSITNSQVINDALAPIDPLTGLPNDSLTGPSANPTAPNYSLAVIQAGGGGMDAIKGVGGAGGLISGLTLKGFNFAVVGGTGGNGVSAGGSGGGVSSVSVLGSSGSLPGDAYHAQSLYVASGSGGNGSAGKGGAGGSINSLAVANADFGLADPTTFDRIITTGNATTSEVQQVGVVPANTFTLTFEGQTTAQLPASDTAADVQNALNSLSSINTAGGVTVQSVTGGYLITFVNPGIQPLIIPNPAVTAGFDVVTGSGGMAGKGAGGAGGGITDLRVTDADFLTDQHPLGNFGTGYIATGNGGAAPGAGGKGGAGGSMTSVTVIGTRLAFSTNGVQTTGLGIVTGNGGAGGLGAAAGKGGAGGSMTGVAIRTAEGLYPSFTTQSVGLLLDTTANFVSDGIQVGDEVENSLTFATTTVTSVTATELGLTSDIFAAGDPYEVIVPGATPTIYSGTAQASQDTIIDATANFTAYGIQVGDIVEDITDTQANNNVPVTAVVTQVFSATQLNVSTDISHVGDQYEIVTLAGAELVTGYGGAGTLTGAGGAGGTITSSNAEVPGTVSMTAGAGGGGGIKAAAGTGGGLHGDGAFSTFGAGLLMAGDAGTAGAKPGAGGSVTGANIQALTNVELIGGNGFAGGAGGSVTSSGFSGVLNEGAGFNPPSGNITVQAGIGGSTGTGNGGAGGSITGMTGFISSGDEGGAVVTQFVAGAGGGGEAHGGAGGSVSGIRFFGGGGPNVTFFINGGDAGNAATGKTGATGGSVTDIGGGTFVSGTADPNFSINTATDFHHISAGDGGDAVKTGGVGGSVNDVFVNAAIGLRYGALFGFDIDGIDGATVTGAGGISAGAGGTGATQGQAGNVTNISADAIASIVAGHLHVGSPLLETNLAKNVSGIILNGSTAPTLVQEFNLTFDGQTTNLLPTDATVTQVAAALNGLSP